MAAQQQGPSVTVDQALQELAGAGSVAGLAQQAMLDYLGGLAAAKATRLRREVLRLGQKLGRDAPETQAATALADAHAVFVAAVKTEQERAAVPVPPLDPRMAIVYGRVLGAGGPAAGATIEALATADQTSLGRTVTDANGIYQLSLPISTGTALHLQVRGRDQVTVTDSGTLTLQSGTRAYREIVLSARPAPGGPSPGGPAGQIMPNLVGMTESRALEILTGLGISSVTSRRQAADQPAGQVIGQMPAADQPLETGISVTLTISAGMPVEVPDLVGMTGAEATVALNRLGLSLGAIDGDRARGKVVWQKPAAGEKAMAGSAVDLTFGSG
jgi:hypothetical protein